MRMKIATTPILHLWRTSRPRQLYIYSTDSSEALRNTQCDRWCLKIERMNGERMRLKLPLLDDTINALTPDSGQIRVPHGVSECGVQLSTFRSWTSPNAFRMSGVQGPHTSAELTNQP